MPIHNVTVTAGGIGLSSEINKISQDANNGIDDIHPQYEGLTLYDLSAHGIFSTGFDNHIYDINMQGLDFSGGVPTIDRMRVGGAVSTASYPKLMHQCRVSFPVKAIVSLDVVYDLFTGTTSSAQNEVYMEIWSHTPGADDVLQHTGALRTGSVANTWEAGALENVTIASMGLSPTDLVTVVTIGSVKANGTGIGGATKALRVTKKY